MKQVPLTKSEMSAFRAWRGRGSLAEAMLKFAGVIDRLGKVTDGTTVTALTPRKSKNDFN